MPGAWQGSEVPEAFQSFQGPSETQLRSARYMLGPVNSPSGEVTVVPRLRRWLSQGLRPVAGPGELRNRLAGHALQALEAFR